MRRPFRILLSITVTALLALAPLLEAMCTPRQVYVSSTATKGQAMLFSFRGQCLALLPTHVLNAGSYVALTGQRTSASAEELGGQGDLLGHLPDIEDVSVASVSGALSSRCGEEFIAPPSARDFPAAQQGAIRSINQDGSVAQRLVEIVDDSLVDYIHVSALGSERLTEGLSGSLLFVDERPVGMLMSVIEQNGQLYGRVLRLQVAYAALNKLLSQGVGDLAQPASEAAIVCGDAWTSALEAPKEDIASEARGARIAGWTGEIVDAQHRPENVLSRDPNSCPWMVNHQPNPTNPATISIELAGDRLPTITSIGIDGSGTEGSGALPNQIEIATRSAPDQRWSPLRTVMLTKQKPYIDLTFGPTRARQIQLRIFSNWGGRQVGLRRITVGAAE